MSTKKTKLALTAETLRSLTADAMFGIRGGQAEGIVSDDEPWRKSNGLGGSCDCIDSCFCPPKGPGGGRKTFETDPLGKDV